MKKNKIIELIGGLSIAVAGVAAVVSGVKENKVESVSADGETKTVYFEPGVWNDAGAILWLHPHDGGADVLFSAVTDGICTATANASCNSFTFVRGNTSGGPGKWGTDYVWNQTDYTFTDSKNYLKVDNWNNYSQHFYNPNGTNKCLVRGDYGKAPTWSESTAISMSSNGDNEIFAVVPLKAGNSFRFYTDNKLDPYWNTENTNIKSTSPAKVTKSGDNFVCGNDLVEGAYVIYYTYSGSDLGVYIAKTTDTAVSLSVYVLQSDTEGQHSTKFYSAKSRYLLMNESEQTAFKNEATTVGSGAEIYVAWATYLGQKPWEEGAASVSPKTNTISTLNDSGTSAWIIAVASLFSLTVLGSLVFYKKRRQK